MMDKTKIFSMDEVRNILKLSESLGKKKIDQFGKWDEFFKIYCKLYSRQSIACKYTSNNKNNYKNYVFVESKEQAILARILLDLYGNHPSFISENLKIGQTENIPLVNAH